MRRVYRGFGVACLGAAAYRALYFALYDALRPLLPWCNVATRFALGWAVTAASMAAVRPIDAVRRRAALAAGRGGAGPSAVGVLATVVREEGAMALWRGAGAGGLRGIAGGAVLAFVDTLRPVYAATCHRSGAAN